MTVDELIRLGSLALVLNAIQGYTILINFILYGYTIHTFIQCYIYNSFIWVVHMVTQYLALYTQFFYTATQYVRCYTTLHMQGYTIHWLDRATQYLQFFYNMATPGYTIRGCTGLHNTFIQYLYGTTQFFYMATPGCTIRTFI